MFKILSCSLLFILASALGVPLQQDANPMYGKYYQGDMRFPEGFNPKNGIIGDQYRWPNNIVPYELSSRFDANEVSLILGSLAEISEKTCITFVERTTQTDYVVIDRGQPNSGCWSYVGRQGGSQILNLQPPPGAHCIWHGIVAHEMIHAIGFYHEQSRTDRDDYVDIMWDNIIPGLEYNFEVQSSDAQGISYDYGSLMHYGSDAFAVDISKPTIVPKIDVEIGQRDGLSDSDAQKIRNMYNC